MCLQKKKLLQMLCFAFQNMLLFKYQFSFSNKTLWCKKKSKITFVCIFDTFVKHKQLQIDKINYIQRKNTILNMYF